MKKYRMKKEISFDFNKFENLLSKSQNNNKVEDKNNSNKNNEKGNI